MDFYESLLTTKTFITVQPLLSLNHEGCILMMGNQQLQGTPVLMESNLEGSHFAIIDATDDESAAQLARNIELDACVVLQLSMADIVGIYAQYPQFTDYCEKNTVIEAWPAVEQSLASQQNQPYGSIHYYLAKSRKAQKKNTTLPDGFVVKATCVGIDEVGDEDLLYVEMTNPIADSLVLERGQQVGKEKGVRGRASLK